jgi:hypothetical protein
MKRETLADMAAGAQGASHAQAMTDLLHKLDSQVNKHLAGVTQRRCGPNAAIDSPIGLLQAQLQLQPQPQPQPQATVPQPARTSGRSTCLLPTLATGLVSTLCVAAWVFWGATAGHDRQTNAAALTAQELGNGFTQKRRQEQSNERTNEQSKAHTPAQTGRPDTVPASSPAHPPEPACSNAVTALGLCGQSAR